MQMVTTTAKLPKSGACIVICNEETAAAEEKRLKGNVPAGTRMYGRKALVDALLKQDQSFGKSGELAQL